jgi:hypothetical protein
MSRRSSLVPEMLHGRLVLALSVMVIQAAPNSTPAEGSLRSPECREGIWRRSASRPEQDHRRLYAIWVLSVPAADKRRRA